MEASVLNRDFRHFRSPEESFGGLASGTAAHLIATAADIALVVDRAGVIRDVAFNEDLAHEGYGAWIGRPWIETVTVESRPKITAMIEDVDREGRTQWRQVNHPSPRGPDVPVRYATHRVADGRLVAVGRDLRSMAVLQQRLVDAQQSMEREYARLRHAETRYRMLFQLASEPVLIVDASSQKVLDANPAAIRLFDEDQGRVVGSPLPDLFDPGEAVSLQNLLARARTAGQTGEVEFRLAFTRRPVLLAGSLFRQENAAHLLVRLSDIGERVAPSSAKAGPDVVRIMAGAPDAFVVTDPQGSILTANPAFLDLVQLATEEQVRGQSLARWLGRPGVDLNVVAANLRQHGAVRLFRTIIDGEHGGTTEVELSAVHVPDGAQPCFGFVIRTASRRSPQEGRGGRDLPRSVEQLTELVGRVPLKDLVRETTDVIEQLCIEAALEITGDNRASAAEILGLSRQSLYVKLRRYGLGDLEDVVEDHV